jgi:hypothetical protein
MTKRGAALPLSVVAEQNPFFITLGGPKVRNFSGRDDKGEGGASSECGCRTESLAESLANTKELSSRRFVRAEGLSCCGPSEQLSTAGKESLWNGKYEVRNATRMAQ